MRLSRTPGLFTYMLLAVVAFVILIPTRQMLIPRGEITLWIGLVRSEVEAVENLVKIFEKEEGTTVRVVWVANIEDLRSRYRVGVPIGKGPDVLLGPHDWIGEFAEMGVIAPITDEHFPESEKSKFFEKALSAVTYENKIWGFPCLMESLVLIYNSGLVENTFEDWEDLLNYAKSVRRPDFFGFYYPHVDPYYSFPIMSGYGAYVFGDEENVENIGLANPGAIDGARFIQQMVKDGVLPIDTTLNPYSVREYFKAGRAAVIIDGPWAFEEIRRAGITYRISNFPKLPNGEYPKTFVGVQVCMVNPKSKNFETAMNLAKFLSSENSQRTLHQAGWRIPSRLDVLAEMENKEEVRIVLAQIENGIIMPKIPEMDSVWTPWTNALKMIVLGQDPASTLEEAVQQMKESIAKRR
ncbi:MAG: maltose ABC transporter substrate-binding protein [Candidatus Hadarchaeales archaeon]